MEYQLELANKQIQELQEKLLQAESQLIRRSSEELSTIEIQAQQIHQLQNENYALQQEVSHLLQVRLNIEDYCLEMSTKFNSYIDQIEEQNIFLKQDKSDLINQVENMRKEIRTIKRTQDQYKKDYKLRMIDEQDKILQAQKENQLSQCNTLKCRVLDDQSEKSISIQSSGHFELQNELNRNIQLLNLKLKSYNTK